MMCCFLCACGSSGSGQSQQTGVSAAEQPGTGAQSAEPASSKETKEEADGADADNSKSETAYDGAESLTEAASDIYGFHVSGNKLLDANGNEFIMRGINHAHTWYATYDLKAFEAIAETGSNCIRIVCSNGVQWSEDHDKTVLALINQSKKNKMIAIVEVHDATGQNDLDSLSKAVDYWCNMASIFEGTEAYCILNIANEWMGDWNTDRWCEGYVDAVKRIRAAGIHNTILVDAAGWGQYGKSIAEKGTQVFEADPEHNTMFAIHMYGTAGKNEQTIRENIDGVLNQNLCLCIGEFGYTHSDGDVDEAFLMQYCEEKGVGYLGWSWKGNGGGVEYLDISNDWQGKELSPDWGVNLIDGPNGIRETAKMCSVYEQQ